jgi:hypothetical protein
MLFFCEKNTNQCYDTIRAQLAVVNVKPQNFLGENILKNHYTGPRFSVSSASPQEPKRQRIGLLESASSSTPRQEPASETGQLSSILADDDSRSGFKLLLPKKMFRESIF